MKLYFHKLDIFTIKGILIKRINTFNEYCFILNIQNYYTNIGIKGENTNNQIKENNKGNNKNNKSYFKENKNWILN